MMVEMGSRTDRVGNSIVKGDKSHRITFADQVSKDRSKLTDVYYVESYKKYNYENSYGQDNCCTII